MGKLNDPEVFIDAEDEDEVRSNELRAVLNCVLNLVLGTWLVCVPFDHS